MPSPPTPLANVVQRTRTLGGGYPTKARSMYIGRDFDPSNPTETEVYSIDFVNELAQGETVNSISAVALTVFRGTDSNPSSHLSGSSSLTGTVASQKIANLLPNVTYRLAFTVVTSLSNTVTLYSRIPCLAIN